MSSATGADHKTDPHGPHGGHDHDEHHHQGFIRTYIFSTDHKMIGIQFLFTGLIMMILGGVLALGVRWQLAWPYDLPAGKTVHEWLPESIKASPKQGTPALTLKAGDVVTKVGGTAVEDAAGLAEALGELEAGSTVKMQVYREGKRRNYDVVLGEASDRGIRAVDGQDPDTETAGAKITELDAYTYGMTGEFYTMIFTMHATIMIFFVIIPLLTGAFGNYLIPLQIGARDMAFPLLNMLSYWMVPVAAVIMLSGFFAQGGHAAAGWTSYPPLAGPGAGEGAFTPGSTAGQTYWLVSLLILGFGSIFGAVNYVTTIIKLRAPGMTLFRMPLATWSLFITSILVLFGTPVLASALTMQILDRTLGTNFFQARQGGQPLLWQHVFWFYSHPAVYIMILPGMGMVSDVLSTFARKPIFGYRAMVYAIAAIAGLGFIVWGHHMFMSGMNPYLGVTFMISTMMIALPSAIKTFNWLGTLWKSQIQFTVPMLNALAFVSMFVIGGLSGIYMAATPVDIFIHDTYFIVGHIHYVLFGGSLFAIFAGIYYWFPKMFGRMMNAPLGYAHFVLSFIFFNVTFFPMHIIGMAGHPRRIAVGWDKVNEMGYRWLADVQWQNELMTIGALCLGAAQIFLFVNFFWSLFAGKKAEGNPWKANSLEWCAAPSPPPHLNWGPNLPIVHHGPYEYSSPLVEEDYLPQTKKIEPKKDHPKT